MKDEKSVKKDTLKVSLPIVLTRRKKMETSKEIHKTFLNVQLAMELISKYFWMLFIVVGYILNVIVEFCTWKSSM